MTTVSVAIPTKDRPAELAACVRSVLAQEPPPEEIIIVDQSAFRADTALAAMCGDADVPLRYEYAPEVSGAAAARNRAASLAGSDVVLFLDDDVELLPGYLAAVRAVFDADERGEVGGASGYTVNYVRTLSPAKRLRSALFYHGPFSAERDPLIFHLRPGRGPRPARRLHGSNMILRRTALADVRFDETYTGYTFGEDRDLSALLARRTTLLWIPEATLLHHESPRSRLSRERFCELRVLSWLHFYRTYTPRSLGSLLAYIWLNAGFVTLALAVWDPPTAAGTLRGFRRLFGVVWGRQSLREALGAGWRPG